MSRLLPVLALALLAARSSAGDGDFDSNGVRIHYVTAGAGQPLVLVHGWMSDTGMWGPKDAAGNTQLDTKDIEGFRLIALDFRGHGKSDGPREPAKYGKEMAEDIVRLLDHLELERAHLLGYSAGAYLVGTVAALHPERVSSVIFAGQAPLVTGAPSTWEDIEAFGRVIDAGGDLGEYILSIAPRDKPLPTPAQASAIADWAFAGKDVEAIVLAGRSFKELEVPRDALLACPAPFLFVHGANESAHVKGRVARAREVLARGELVLIEGGDHMTTLTKPQFSETVLAFLRAVPAPEATPLR